MRPQKRDRIRKAFRKVKETNGVFWDIVGALLMIGLAVACLWMMVGCGIGNESVRMLGDGDKRDKTGTQIGLINLSEQIDAVRENTSGLKTKIENTREILFWWLVKGGVLVLAYREGRDLLAAQFKKRKAG